jgi:hypothetical protein
MDRESLAALDFILIRKKKRPCVVEDWTVAPLYKWFPDVLIVYGS